MSRYSLSLLVMTTFFSLFSFGNSDYTDCAWGRQDPETVMVVDAQQIKSTGDFTTALNEFDSFLSSLSSSSEQSLFNIVFDHYEDLRSQKDLNGQIMSQIVNLKSEYQIPSSSLKICVYSKNSMKLDVIDPTSQN